MNYNESNTMNNIYSEPLFPISQGCPLSVSSSSLGTQLTQTQGATQLDEGGREEGLEQEEESDQDSETSDFDSFTLDSMVVRASRMVQDYCTTGCPRMDQTLNGGIPTFGITELYGEGGTGKTQLCLQLAITAQLPKACGGLDAGGVYYICTEDALPTKRLLEMVRSFTAKFPTDLPEDPMSNIFIEQVTEAEELMQCIDIKLSSLARSSSDKKIRLVIVDSVAAVFRTELDDLSQRTHELRRLAQTLHEYSHDHQASVVVCNQASASPTLEGNVASLGLVWKNLITTRIRMSKCDREETLSRNLYVSFSPHVPSVGVAFQITASGVEVTQPQQQEH